ncbi:hypothetical protein [Nostoc sp. 106C]|nr:hypothetical protein [Nostoc sp. 106C]
MPGESQDLDPRLLEEVGDLAAHQLVLDIAVVERWRCDLNRLV